MKGRNNEERGQIGACASGVRCRCSGGLKQEVTVWPSEQKNGQGRSGDRPESNLFRKSLAQILSNVVSNCGRKELGHHFLITFMTRRLRGKELKYLPFQHHYRVIQRTQAAQESGCDPARLSKAAPPASQPGLMAFFQSTSVLPPCYIITWLLTLALDRP